MKTDKQIVIDTVTDSVADLLYYNRKNDEDLPVGKIEQLIIAGVISKDEIINSFAAEIRKI